MHFQHFFSIFDDNKPYDLRISKLYANYESTCMLLKTWLDVILHSSAQPNFSTWLEKYK